MKTLPIRWRVTSAFAASLLLVLATVGAFIYLRLDVELTKTLDRGMQARVEDVSAAVRSSPGRLSLKDAPTLAPDETLAQVLSDGGTVVAGTSGAQFPLLAPSELARARTGTVFADRQGDGKLDESVRLLAVPVQLRGETLIVVVGMSLDEKHEALGALRNLEVIGLTAALLVSSGVGYLIAGLALRPVEGMRRRAEEIADHPDTRLPAPAVDDEIGRLGVTLNQMLDKIGRARALENAAVARERELVARERQLVDRERQFIADASHELRTPLTILKSEVEVALIGDRSVQELETALRSTLQETDRLCRLAEDLLLLAEHNEAGVPFRGETLVVADLLEAVAGRQRRRMDAVGRLILTEAPPGVAVTADRLLLERALTNLIDNAIAHGRGDVEVRAAYAGDVLCIAVHDQGPGFPPSFGEHAFERFTRAEAGRSGQGTGLGLPIVSAAAQAHGGTATIGSGQGGCVQFTLPAYRVSSDQAPRLRGAGAAGSVGSDVDP